MLKGGNAYRIVTDHLGSVRLVVDAQTGAIAQEMSYDEFGRVLSDTNPGFQPFGFAGGLWDADTGLVRFGARDYDPEVGRWTAKDPLLFDGLQANLFMYVGNDPVNRTDPTGLITINCGGMTTAQCAVKCVTNGMACLPVAKHPFSPGVGWGKLTACSNDGPGPFYTCAYVFPDGDVCVQNKPAWLVPWICTGPNSTCE